MTLKEAQDKLEHKQKALNDIFEKAKVAGLGQHDFAKVDDPFFDGAKDTSERLDIIHKAEAELNDLFDTAKKLADTEAAHKARQERMKEPVKEFKHPTGKESKRELRELKRLGELAVESKQYTEWGKNGTLDLRFAEIYPSEIFALGMKANTLQEKAAELKVLMQTTDGYAPESIRMPGFVEIATRPIQLLDIIPFDTTQYEQVKYMEETIMTPGAEETAEAGTYPEAEYQFEEKLSPVRKIADSLPVTDEQLEDVSFMSSYINNRLVFGIRRRLDSQVIQGDGAGVNLQGLKTLTGIQTQAKGTDPTPDAFFKAMTKVRVTGRAMPTHHVIHSNTWEQIRLLRTADGLYIWGNPSEPGPERMWGLPVVQNDVDVDTEGYTGSFQPTYVTISERRGVDVQVGYVDAQFKQGIRTVRGDMRAALTFFRPAAFCKITGL